MKDEQDIIIPTLPYHHRSVLVNNAFLENPECKSFFPLALS
jgi:hypothetical protein